MARGKGGGGGFEFRQFVFQPCEHFHARAIIPLLTVRKRALFMPRSFICVLASQHSGAFDDDTLMTALITSAYMVKLNYNQGLVLITSIESRYITIKMVVRIFFSYQPFLSLPTPQRDVIPTFSHMKWHKTHLRVWRIILYTCVIRTIHVSLVFFFLYQQR